MNEIDIHIEDRRGVTPLPSEVAAATALASLLSIAQDGALSSNLAMALQVHNTDLAGKAQVARQQGMDRLRLSLLAKAVGKTQALSPLAARSAVAGLTGNALAQQIADLSAALAALKSRES